MKTNALQDRYPNLIADTVHGWVEWKHFEDMPASENVKETIPTLLRLRAIPYEQYQGFYCLYPNEFNGEYLICLVVDAGKIILLLSAPQGFHFMQSGEMIDQINDSIYLFQCSDDNLTALSCWFQKHLPA